MKKYCKGLSILINFIVISLVSVNCSAESQGITQASKEHTSKVDFISSGGVLVDGHLCPIAANDTIVPITYLNPDPFINEPKMSIEGMLLHIEKNEITNIAQLLNTFPDFFRSQFSLVEHTKATGQSNLRFPRIVLFGPDGQFLLNIGTLKQDPKYHLLDMAELNDKTGKWEFSFFDFSGKNPVLTRNSTSCIECHGNVNSRPIWGTNMQWAGVFGDNIAPGPNGEALDSRHAQRMNEIQSGQGGNPRFDFLNWAGVSLNRGSIRPIAEHAFGAELLISNMAIGSASARGIFLQLKANFPKRYEKLREAILILGYEKLSGSLLVGSIKDKIIGLLKEYNANNNDLDGVFSILGVNPAEAFSLATLAEKEQAVTHWSLGGGDLYELVLLQVLDDLARDDSALSELLTNTKANKGVFGCPNTVTNIRQLVNFKMLHLFHLKGRSRFEVNKVFYPRAVEHITDRVFKPIAGDLNTYLHNKVLTASHSHY